LYNNTGLNKLQS